jgi:hypothetical protein
MEYEAVLIDASESPIERPKKRVRNRKRIKNRNNKQKHFYSGKKKRHTLKSQVVVDKKSSKKKPLTKEEKEQNRKISSERVLNENVIGSLKILEIINDRCRNRRKRFGLRFNLI